MTSMDEENVFSLFLNTTSFASGMLKKEDKVTMLLKASHLYNSSAVVKISKNNFVEK